MENILAFRIAALAVAAIAVSPPAYAAECAWSGAGWICPRPQVAYAPQQQVIIQPYSAPNQLYQPYLRFDRGALRYPGPALHSAGD